VEPGRKLSSDLDLDKPGNRTLKLDMDKTGNKSLEPDADKTRYGTTFKKQRFHYKGTESEGNRYIRNMQL